jgi:hypothetical protein
MPAATATFSDSVPPAMGTATSRWHRARTSSAQPGPLVAHHQRHPRPCPGAIERLAPGVRAQHHEIVALQPRPQLPRAASTTGRRNSAPADARTDLAFQGSTVPGRQASNSQPNAAADRASVPMLPGSCTASSTSTRASGPLRPPPGSWPDLRHHQDPLRAARVGQLAELPVRHPRTDPAAARRPAGAGPAPCPPGRAMSRPDGGQSPAASSSSTTRTPSATNRRSPARRRRRPSPLTSFPPPGSAPARLEHPLHPPAR